MNEWTLSMAAAAVRSHTWMKDKTGRQRCSSCGARPWTPLSACGAFIDTPELQQHRRDSLIEASRPARRTA